MTRFSNGAWLSGIEVSENGHAAYVPNVRLSGADGGAVTPSSATNSQVASAAVSTSLLASNASRKGATITNTDVNTLYLDLSGGTASATSYTLQLPSGGYYEVPYGYTGPITGIWAADGTGYALITEFA